MHSEEYYKNNNNNSMTNNNVQWNIWQQFQWPNQPEQNRWSKSLLWFVLFVTVEAASSPSPPRQNFLLSAPRHSFVVFPEFVWTFELFSSSFSFASDVGRAKSLEGCFGKF
jgi:hypothetical protein